MIALFQLQIWFIARRVRNPDDDEVDGLIWFSNSRSMGNRIHYTPLDYIDINLSAGEENKYRVSRQGKKIRWAINIKNSVTFPLIIISAGYLEK